MRRLFKWLLVIMLVVSALEVMRRVMQVMNVVRELEPIVRRRGATGRTQPLQEMD